MGFIHCIHPYLHGRLHKEHTMDKRDNRRFLNPSVLVLSMFSPQTIGFILSHLVKNAHVSQLVFRGQAPSVLFTCAKYKEVKVKRQLHFKNSNLNTVFLRLMTER